ncbi:ogr/Delta-like zinc finger family protein [Xenorhabdus hominickii]|uniref:Transcriptional regulator n=1 Tax=Xenorhabdus hominickii TaxID=351679 RepID=A0ABM6DVP8_XENHO|nr:ogr/Delta-like zinc finger family protein [Xenorhabdus hominickii]AOM42209.1 transcriptional regulator [Xenorhabdus hominickii]
MIRCCGWKLGTTNRKHPEIADPYCVCSDIECGYRFVMNLTFSHTLSPSAKTGDKLLRTIVNNLNLQQRLAALALLKADSAASCQTISER